MQGKKRAGVEEDDMTYARILGKVKSLPKQIEKHQPNQTFPKRRFNVEGEHFLGKLEKAVEEEAQVQAKKQEIVKMSVK